MRAVLPFAAFTVALCLSPLAAAQETADCPACGLGIYEDPGMTRNFGTWNTAAAPSKEIFVGIRYGPGAAVSALTGIELSIDGLPLLFLPPAVEGFDTLLDPDQITGDIRSPADTTRSGGFTISWDACQPGDRALLRLTLISFDPIPSDQVVRVRHRFPPATTTSPAPFLLQCDAPSFTRTRATGGCYVLNPTVGPGESVADCLLADYTSVQPLTWSGIKSLYR
jgi:hypothetical protein